MSDLNDVIDNDSNGSISTSMKENIKKTAPWMQFLGILFMILGGLGFIGSIISLFASPLAGLINLIIIGIYFYLGLLLFQSGNSYSSFSKTNSVGDLEASIAKQQKYWMIMGILVIVSIVFVIISLVAGGAMIASLRGGM